MKIKNKIKNKTDSKKSISTIIAAVILILVTVILITVVLNWSQLFTNKQVEKASKFASDTIAVQDATLMLKTELAASSNYIERIIVKNLTSNTTGILTGYKILVEENPNDYNFLNTKIDFDTEVTVLPGNINNFEVVCFPSRKFDLLLYTNHNTSEKIKVNVNTYDPLSCAQYYSYLNPPTITVNELTTFNTNIDLNGTISDTSATLSLILDGTTYTPTNNKDGTWTLPYVNELVVGSYDVNICATDTYGLITCDESDTNELIIYNPCSDGYVLVPNDPTYNTGDFCVMQFEAKNDGFNSPVSTVAGTPWVSISQAESISACTSLEGGDYHLITNDEWMTIARNIESQSTNWSGEAVGSGFIPRGNSDGFSALDGTDALSGINKRNLVLSNGNEIYDLAGNVAEWVDKTIQQKDMPQPGSSWVEYIDITDYGVLERDAYNFAVGKEYSSVNGIGKIYSTYSVSEDEKVFLRGGYWNYGPYAGLLYLTLSNDSSDQIYNDGFRCSVVP